MQVEALRRTRQRPADLPEGLLLDGGLAALVLLAFAVEVRPAPVEPVRLVRPVFLAGLEFLAEVGLEGGLHLLDVALGNEPFLHQPLRILLQRRLLRLDARVHVGLREHRLVALVVAEASVAEHVDDDVLVELLPELGRDLGGVHHRLRIVAVDVEDRCFDHERDVGGIGRGARVLWRRREPDLVVHDDMNGAAGAMADEAGETEAFRDDALAGERRVAVQKDRQHRGAVGIASLRLLGAGLAQDHRVHRLEMAGICGQRQVHAVAVELAVRRRAEVVLDVARPLHVLWLEGAALEFAEDRPVGLGHHVGEHAEAAAVRHADHDLLHAEGAAALDDLLHGGNERLAAVEAETLGAHVLNVKELLEALGFDQLVEDRAPALLGEADLLAVAFDPFLEPCRLLGVGDVHVLKREGAAVGAPDDRQDLAQRGRFEAEHLVDEDRPVHVGLGEAVGPWIEFGVLIVLAHPEWVEVGNEVAADAVRADDHQRADRVEHRALDLVVSDLRRRLGRLLADRCVGLGRRFRPFARERRSQLVVRRRRPVGAGP